MKNLVYMYFSIVNETLGSISEVELLGWEVHAHVVLLGIVNVRVPSERVYWWDMKVPAFPQPHQQNAFPCFKSFINLVCTNFSFLKFHCWFVIITLRINPFLLFRIHQMIFFFLTPIHLYNFLVTVIRFYLSIHSLPIKKISWVSSVSQTMQ